MAQQLNTKIISADSRQCYKELNIGVAKPTTNELAVVQHYFINSHSINENVNAGIFEKYALEKVCEIFDEKDVAVMVGGTGLYINAFCNGIDEMPIVPIEIRNNIILNYKKLGLNWLQSEVQTKDFLFWQTAEQNNPQRLMRALEIVEFTGNSITTYKKNSITERPFNIIKVGLELPKEQLYQRINLRVDKMIEEGLVEEVQHLKQFEHLNALQTVGYKELFDFMNNKMSRIESIEKIKINTRHYAKRQMTWFKKDATIKWINPNNSFDLNSIL